MSPEAPLEPTEHGLLPAAEGWFVLNATDAPWQDWAGRMQQMAKQGQADFSQLGVGLYVLSPGQPMSMYHRETDQEDFLVLSGERSRSWRARSARSASGTSCTARLGPAT